MDNRAVFNIPQEPRFHNGPPEVGVHVLSEHVFCPRAALLARESGVDSGEEGVMPSQCPDGVFDYDEHRFVEAIHAAWADVRFWLMMLAPALIFVLAVWRLWSPMTGLMATLPFFYCLARLWECGVRVVDLIREQAVFNAAAVTEVDSAATGIRQVNWWSLRKAGFDCLKPADSMSDPEYRLAGKPWRMLVKGTTLRIPVIRKHRGERVWRPQHRVRISAYCRLIEVCQGGHAPFGILLFADSYECLIIPNTVVEKSQFEQALEEVRDFLRLQEQGQFAPMKPVDNRCRGCPFGEPRQFERGQETKVNGMPIVPLQTNAADNKLYHCPCGDRFNWVPPHELAVKLRIAQRR
jgi:hypothetical protein